MEEAKEIMELEKRLIKELSPFQIMKHATYKERDFAYIIKHEMILYRDVETREARKKIASQPMYELTFTTSETDKEKWEEEIKQYKGLRKIIAKIFPKPLKTVTEQIDQDGEARLRRREYEASLTDEQAKQTCVYWRQHKEKYEQALNELINTAIKDKYTHTTH